ncbi:MAG: hypothetical protein JWO58_3353, partial [Chitinophagaceae bacterium]|nr:hypothetical protein [Chitinophagaceae bacterium]
APYADPMQFDSTGHYFEPRATKEKPVWYAVDVAFVKEFKAPVLLQLVRDSSQFSKMMILQSGSRLSITPVDEMHAKAIIDMAT